MPPTNPPTSASCCINPRQLLGVESYQFADGPARGQRALWVNSGSGLRFRVLPDRGMDIDQAFFGEHSLCFLTHLSPQAGTRAHDRGFDWLKGFGAGLLTSCGPFNTGDPCRDGGEELGLHGTHVATPAEMVTVDSPDPARGAAPITLRGKMLYGAFYGPCLELDRTITVSPFTNRIQFADVFTNIGNSPLPHAWLLHINFGYPLLDEGSELCVRATKVEPFNSDLSRARFAPGQDYKLCPAPQESHRAEASTVAYLYPQADSAGQSVVGIANRKRGFGVAIRYSTSQFPRVGNWQHFGPQEYVTALEPMTGTVDGRDKDRARNLLRFIEPGKQARYDYSIEVVQGEGLSSLLALNDSTGR